VPGESRIEIDAIVSNRDIGFVNAGDEVEIKIEAEPWTERND
jgi:HlyD family secretion protein/hemolysin D